MQLLGGMDPARFLAEYWQKQPLLVRQAWPRFIDPLSPEELAGLACEDGVTARLVLDREDSPWQLRQGPFTDSDFLDLPASRWTLLVSDVEKLLPELSGLLEPFRFIPDWRFDDLQLSYAPEGGSVGPHWDDYDVFLLQGLGRKRWQLSTQPASADDLRDDTALRILRQFQPDREWVLEPGDMLYLPPQQAHYGVALEPGITYSIGFRAPSQHDLLVGFTDQLLARSDTGHRYADPDLRPAGNPGLLDDNTLERMEQMLRDALAWNRHRLQEWLGCYLSEPKPEFEPEPPEPPSDRATLARSLQTDNVLSRRPGSRLLFHANRDRSVTLFADGKSFRLPTDMVWLGELLCRRQRYCGDELTPALAHSAGALLLLSLINSGTLLFDHDE